MEKGSGFIYACRSRENPLVFKGGFTTHECREQYCYDQYSRILPNLEVYRVLHVPNARLAESMLFVMLAHYRNHKKQIKNKFLFLDVYDREYRKYRRRISFLNI